MLKDLDVHKHDADRMDYLLRDALATGNSIGRFDLDRVLATEPAGLWRSVSGGAVHLREIHGDVFQAIKAWTESSDEVLKDLSRRLLYRQPFKCLEISSRPDVSEIAKGVVAKRGYKDTEYYVFLDSPFNVPYDYYTAVEEEDKPPILAWMSTAI